MGEVATAGIALLFRVVLMVVVVHVVYAKGRAKGRAEVLAEWGRADAASLLLVDDTAVAKGDE